MKQVLRGGAIGSQGANGQIGQTDKVIWRDCFALKKYIFVLSLDHINSEYETESEDSESEDDDLEEQGEAATSKQNNKVTCASALIRVFIVKCFD